MRSRTQYGARAEAILLAGNQHPPMTLRVNCRRISPAEYLALLAQQGIAARLIAPHAVLLERPVPVEKLPGFSDGLVSVQDAGAQYAARSAGRAVTGCACWMPAPRPAARAPISWNWRNWICWRWTRTSSVWKRCAKICGGCNLSATRAVRRCGTAARLVGRPAVSAHTGRCALLGLRRGAPPSRHKVAAPPGGHRRICAAAIADSECVVAAAGKRW